MKAGAGTLVLGGANSYSGGTTIGAGTVALVSGGTLGSGNLTISPGAVLDASALSSYTFTGGTLTAGRSSSPAADYRGSLVVQNATVNVAGSSTAGTLSGNSLTLGGSVSALFDLASTPAGNNDLINLSGNLTISGSNTLAINAYQNALAIGTYPLIDFAGNCTGGTTGQTVTVANVAGNTRPLTYGLVLSGTSNAALELQVTGNPANLVWTGSNGTAWDVVTTQNWTNTNGGTADVFYNLDNVTFDESAGASHGTVSINGTVLPGSITVSNTSVNYTFSGTGSIGGPGGLTKLGPGTLVIDNSNAYSGVTTISGGTLQVGNAAALLNSTVSVGSAGGLSFVLGTTAATLGGLSGGSNFALQDSGGNPVTLSVGNNGNPTTYSGIMSGGSLTKIGSGNLTLSSDVYTGALQNSGAGNLTIGGGSAATLQNSGAGNLSISGSSFTVSGSIINSSGAGNLTISGGLNAATLTQNSSAGILTVNQPAGFSGTIQNVNGTVGTTVVLEGDPTSTTTITASSPLSTAGQTVQFNGGTWISTIGGNFNSSLVVNGGTLAVISGDFTALQSLTVHQGGVVSTTGGSQYGMRMGNLTGLNDTRYLPFTGVQDGGLVSVADTSGNGALLGDLPAA